MKLAAEILEASQYSSPLMKQQPEKLYENWLLSL